MIFHTGNIVGACVLGMVLEVFMSENMEDYINSDRRVLVVILEDFISGNK